MEPILNVFVGVGSVLLLLSPLIALALFVNAVRNNNAKRRRAEQDRLIAGIYAAQGKTPPISEGQLRAPRRPIRADGRKPWYLR